MNPKRKDIKSKWNLKKKDRAFLEFKKEEAEKNRTHELEMLKYLHHQWIILNNREILDMPLLIKLPFFNIRFNTLQILIILRVPHHNLLHHWCHLLNIIMQAHPSGHLKIKIKLKHRINPFQANVPFLYPLKMSEKRRKMFIEMLC